MLDFEEAARMCVCVCLLHSLSRGWARENTEPGKSGVTHANTWKNRRLLFPRRLIFTGDTQVTFRLQLFRYACVCTILFLCSTFFNVCVPSQTFLYACICALCVEKALKHVCAQTCARFYIHNCTDIHMYNHMCELVCMPINLGFPMLFQRIINCILCYLVIAEESWNPKSMRHHTQAFTRPRPKGCGSFLYCERKGQDTAIDRGRQNKPPLKHTHTHIHMRQQ